MIIVYNYHEKHFTNKLTNVHLASLTVMFTWDCTTKKTVTAKSNWVPENFEFIFYCA